MWRTPRTGRLAGRTMLSAQARAYRADCAKRVLAGTRPASPLAGSLVAGIAAYAPDRRARDLDNLPKAVFDALKHCGVIEDDRYIDALYIERREVSRDRPRLEVAIRSLRDDERAGVLLMDER